MPAKKKTETETPMNTDVRRSMDKVKAHAENIKKYEDQRKELKDQYRQLNEKINQLNGHIQNEENAMNMELEKMSKAISGRQVIVQRKN